jgi:hypothetical protein
LAVRWAFKNKQDVLQAFKFGLSTLFYDLLLFVGILLFIAGIKFDLMRLTEISCGVLSLSTLWGLIYAAVLSDKKREANAAHCILYSTIVSAFLAVALPFGLIGM